MGTIDSIWKNVKVGMLGVGTLAIMGGYASAKEGVVMNVIDIPPVRSWWLETVNFYPEEGQAVKSYDIDGDGKDDFRFVSPYKNFSRKDGSKGVVFGIPFLFGFDESGEGKFTLEEMHGIDYTNSQGLEDSQEKPSAKKFST